MSRRFYRRFGGLDQGAGYEQGEAYQQNREVEGFGSDVFLVEHHYAVDEADEHTATAYHRDNGYH